MKKSNEEIYDANFNISTVASHHFNIVRILDESGRLGAEGSLNWELFSSKGNRFFLPGSLGPAWINNLTTIYADVVLHDLVNFGSPGVAEAGRQQDKLQLRSQDCPQLLRENLQEIFPAPEVATPSAPLTLLELTYPRNGQCDQETEKGAKLVSQEEGRSCEIRLTLQLYFSLFWPPEKSAPVFDWLATGQTS